MEFFDEKTGGYVVVDLRRIAHSGKSKNEGKKYNEELRKLCEEYKNGDTSAGGWTHLPCD